jgi:predicted dithiol-disulfide oxidoreductase (DUF899 family)
MMAQDVTTRMSAIADEIGKLESELAALRREAHGETVADYELAGWDGPVRLSGLFRDRDQLIVIHNMGFSCPYCTMWADGFNGLLPHIAERAAFALASPDPVEAQKKGAAKRGWRFPMLSTRGSSFSKDLGFEEDGSPMPGVSTFIRTSDGTIRRHAAAPFGPGDKFCAVWSFADLLPEAPEADA